MWFARRKIVPQPKLKRLINKKLRPHNTRLCALAVDVHLAGFAPAFTLSLGDSERSRNPPNAHSLGRYVQF
jgi:hypothetical protein